MLLLLLYQNDFDFMNNIGFTTVFWQSAILSKRYYHIAAKTARGLWILTMEAQLQP